MKTRPRAILYLRLSVSKDESTSLARQEKDLRELADREGWAVGEVLTDDGLSGGKRREKADHALEQLRQNKADVIAVWKFDRWSRQGVRAVADLVEALDERESQGRPALFVALRDGLRSDMQTWRMHVSLIAEVGRMERENIASRVASSRAFLRQNRRHTGIAPFGYRIVPHPSGVGRALDIDPDEAKTVRAAAESVLGGNTPYTTAKMLNEQGMKPRRADKWSHSAVADLLRRDTLLGYMTHRSKGDSSRTHRPILGEDGRPIQAWPPLLTQEEAAQLRAILKPDPNGWGTKARSARRRASRLLSGLLVCETCGSVMRAGQGDKLIDGSTTSRYVCGAPIGACPGKVSINATLVEEHVTGEFLAVTGHMEVIEVRETAPAVAELALVEAQIQETAAALAAPDADVAALVERLTVLRARRTELESAPSETVIEHIATGETFSEAWEKRDVAGRRRLLEGVLTGKITVRRTVRGYRGMDPSRLSIPWPWTEPDVEDLAWDAVSQG